MSNGHRLHLNLASHPKRNRRLLFLLTGILGGLLVILLAVGGSSVFRYGLRSRAVRRNVIEIDSKIQNADREEKQFTRQVNQAVRERQRWVDNVNQLIYRKSFSWIGLLRILEEMLPDACYIVSLAPAFKEDAAMDINFKVAAPNDDVWMTLVERLYTSGFKDVRQKSEIRGRDGSIIFDMSVRYERDN